VVLPHSSGAAIPIYNIGYKIGSDGQCLPGEPIGYRMGRDGRPQHADIGFVAVPK
jgi:hypothetical protein